MNDSKVTMFGRRNGKSMVPTLLAIATILVGGYAYYMYRELNSKYENSESKLGMYMKRQLSLKSQLQVVYEHRSKLEAVVIKQREEHQSTKQSFIKKLKECMENLTKAKQEALNRFNALDTEHHKLKAMHDEVSSDFSRLQQQYVRLSEDHRKIVAGHKEDYETLKSMKESESKSLHARVQMLFGDHERCKTDLTKYKGYYQSERVERLRLFDKNGQCTKQLAVSKEDASLAKKEKESLEEKLQESQNKINELEKKINELKGSKEIIEEAVASPAITEASRISPTTRVMEKVSSPSAENSIERPIGRKGKKYLVLKPSDKVKSLLIGKEDLDGNPPKKEDSIKDQYEMESPSEQDKSKPIIHKEKDDDAEEDSLKNQYQVDEWSERSTPKMEAASEGGDTPEKKEENQAIKGTAENNDKEEQVKKSTNGESTDGEKDQVEKSEQSKKSVELDQSEEKGKFDSDSEQKPRSDKSHDKETGDESMVTKANDVVNVVQNEAILDNNELSMPRNQFDLAKMNIVKNETHQKKNDSEIPNNQFDLVKKINIFKKVKGVINGGKSKNETGKRVKSHPDTTMVKTGAPKEVVTTKKATGDVEKHVEVGNGNEIHPDGIPLDRADLEKKNKNDNEKQNNKRSEKEHDSKSKQNTHDGVVESSLEKEKGKLELTNQKEEKKRKRAEDFKEDDGTSFIKRQQKLMHRQKPHRKRIKNEEDSEELAEKLEDVQLDKAEDNVAEKKRVPRRILKRNAARNRRQLPPPFVKKGKQIEGDNNDEDVTEQKQVAKSHQGVIAEHNEKLDNDKVNEQTKQLHAPIKKPQRNNLKKGDAKWSEGEALEREEDQSDQLDKESDGQGFAPLSHTHDDDENGDQDLDGQKNNDDHRDADSQDEDKTNDLGIETALQDREDVKR